MINSISFFRLKPEKCYLHVKFTFFNEFLMKFLKKYYKIIILFYKMTSQESVTGRSRAKTSWIWKYFKEEKIAQNDKEINVITVRTRYNDF